MIDMAERVSTGEDEDLQQLLQAADEDVERAVTEYEPLESAYRAATTSAEIFPEVVNTRMVPRALMTTATSAG